MVLQLCPRLFVRSWLVNLIKTLSGEILIGFLFLIYDMIERITVENLRLEDYNYYVGSIIGKQTILNSRDVFSVYYDQEFPAIRMLERLCDFRKHPNYTDNIFGVSEGSTGYGCIDIEFTRKHNPDSVYRYVQQYMDAVPYFETLANRNNIIEMNQDGELESELDILNSYSPWIEEKPNYYGRYHIFYNNAKCKEMMNDFSEISYLNTYEFIRNDIKLLSCNNLKEESTQRESVFTRLNIYNRYLEMLGMNKIIKVRSDYYYPTLVLDSFMVCDTSLQLFSKRGNSYPLSSEGGGFFRILHTIDAIEKAKSYKSPLIINSFCAGVDRDKSDILFNYIKQESGRSIPYSILTVVE